MDNEKIKNVLGACEWLSSELAAFYGEYNTIMSYDMQINIATELTNLTKIHKTFNDWLSPEGE